MKDTLAQPEASVRQALTRVRRVVVKVGSALVTGTDTGLDVDCIARWCAEVDALLARGQQIVIVSSGAVAEGCHRLGLTARPNTIHGLQAAAAVGQMGLVQTYERAFAHHGRRTAMILLTHEDLANRARYLNARSTLNTLLDLGVVPIINENDTVATDEIRFGDNDTLAALVCNLIEAELLVILTDQAGLHEQDPRQVAGAPLVSYAAAEDARLDGMVGDAGALGRGGMITKLQAARIGARAGAHTVIAPGRSAGILGQVLSGQPAGTLLAATVSPMVARKRWIAGQLRAKGDLILDAGAVQALRGKGVSLLPVGVTGVRGTFARGDLVRCLDEAGAVVAQGLVNYSHAEVAALRGCATTEISARIGYRDEPEIIHRDNLVLAGRAAEGGVRADG